MVSPGTILPPLQDPGIAQDVDPAAGLIEAVVAAVAADDDRVDPGPVDVADHGAGDDGVVVGPGPEGLGVEGDRHDVVAERGRDDVGQAVGAEDAGGQAPVDPGLAADVDPGAHAAGPARQELAGLEVPAEDPAVLDRPARVLVAAHAGEEVGLAGPRVDDHDRRRLDVGHAAGDLVGHDRDGRAVGPLAVGDELGAGGHGDQVVLAGAKDVVEDRRGPVFGRGPRPRLGELEGRLERRRRQAEPQFQRVERGPTLRHKGDPRCES